MKREVWCLKQTADEDARGLMPDWWRRDDVDKLWFSWTTGNHLMADTDVIHAVVELEPSDDIPDKITPEQRNLIRILVKQRMLKPENVSGWVAPSGEWFPCGNHRHDEFVFHFYGDPVAVIERSHARVNGEFWSIEGGLVSLPMKQRLIRMGFVNELGDLYHHRNVETPNE